MPTKILLGGISSFTQGITRQSCGMVCTWLREIAGRPCLTIDTETATTTPFAHHHVGPHKGARRKMQSVQQRIFRFHVIEAALLKALAFDFSKFRAGEQLSFSGFSGCERVDGGKVSGGSFKRSGDAVPEEHTANH